MKRPAEPDSQRNRDYNPNLPYAILDPTRLPTPEECEGHNWAVQERERLREAAVARDVEAEQRSLATAGIEMEFMANCPFLRGIESV